MAFELAKAPLASVRMFLEDYLKWPAPAWRLAGYCKVPIGTRSFKLSTGLLAPIQFYRALRARSWKENDVVEFIEANLKEGQTFIDVGAYVGVYSLLAARIVGHQGKVYAFEPDAAARDFCQRNLRMNKVFNVDLMRLAISNRTGPRVMSYLPCSTGNRILDDVCSSEAMNVQGKPAIVEATTLDDFCAKTVLIPDMVKVDVEGHEVEVIEGGMQTLRSSKTTLILEVHNRILHDRGIDPAAFIHWIESLRGTQASHLDTRNGFPSGSTNTHVVFQGIG
jgi:FkbM family methyltransferase